MGTRRDTGGTRKSSWRDTAQQQGRVFGGTLGSDKEEYLGGHWVGTRRDTVGQGQTFGGTVGEDNKGRWRTRKSIWGTLGRDKEGHWGTKRSIWGSTGWGQWGALGDTGKIGRDIAGTHGATSRHVEGNLKEDAEGQGGTFGEDRKSNTWRNIRGEGRMLGRAPGDEG